MLTKNNFTTEAIVAKYVTAVKNLAKERGVYSENYPFAVNEMESFSPHQQLVAKLWFDHEGCPTDHPFLGELSVYKSFFKKSLMSEEEYSFLLDNYKDSIEYLFAERKNWSFGMMAHSDEPKELAELASEILSLEEGQTLFLPFCGYGDFAVKFPQCKIVGFVEDPTIAVLAQIRLDAAGICAEINTRTLDERKDNVLPKHKVDAIICDVRDQELFGIMYQDYSLENLYNILTDNGNMIAICANGVVTSLADDALEFRTKLYKDKSVEAIIQLPEGIYKDTRVSPFLLCIDKSTSNPDNEGIVMFNASFASRDCGVHSNLKRIDVERVLFAIKNAGQPELDDVIRRIPYEKVEPELMIPGYYLLNRDYSSNRRLTDLVDYEPGTRKAPEGKHYSFSLKGHLTSDFKDAKFSLERIDESSPSVPVPGRYYLCHTAEPCIFLAITGEDIMLGYSDVADSDAFYRSLPTVTCLKVKEGISVDYVAALLLSKEIKEQLTAMGAGSVTRRLNHHLLSKVIVPEHSKEQMSEYLEIVLKASMTQREKDMKSERETYERNVRLRKHALTQSISAFGAMFNTLNKCRIRQGGILHDEDKISPVSDKTVAEVFDTLSTRMSSILEKLARIADVDIDFGEPVDIDPEDFILQYIKSKKNGWLNFVGEPSWDPKFARNKNHEELRDPEDNSVIIGVGDTLYSFSFPKAALEHVFNNIVANAIAHGFTDENRSDYKVRFSWESQGLDIVITIENNGAPLPEGVNSKDILSYGYSTKLNVDGHNGIGGSEIATIMQDFHGDVEVQSCPGAEYPVKYILRFHNSNIVGTL